MKPMSAFYYVKENKGRAGIVMFLLFFTTLLYLAGNYIDSNYYYWKRAMEYSDRVATVSAISSDEEQKDFYAFREKLKSDESLIVYDVSGYGYSGLPWICTMGFEMGSTSMIFDSVEDMKDCFERLGIKADLSDMKNGNVCLSSALARQYGLKKGDVVDASVYKNITGRRKIGAIIEDDSYVLFYVEHTDTPFRMHVMSKDLSGQALRDKLAELRGDFKVHIDQPMSVGIEEQFAPFKLIFGAGIVLLSLVLAVVVNSVITGQYIARTYEFGVYRAIGLTKREIYGKCAREILAMDLLAILFGAVVIFLFLFLINELYYIPAGRFLPYYSNIGLYAFLASNALVILPTILLKGRSMSRADVTEF
ncbi:MAG: ABC transporter permease [Lachnospiraceae bacterium]|nr:ABC transporter permease [Lachnospiraceae bacterium]